MSHYTNDTDTLRQMLSMSLPQLLSSMISITAVFFSMLYLSVWLTLFIIVFLFLVLKVAGYIASHSGRYFARQQQNLGDVNAYIEEMVSGQKVVKVFNHEEAAKAVFDQKNQTLCESVTKANTYANILMPIMNNMGHVLYVLVAVIGGSLAIMGVTNVSLAGKSSLTLGMIASFLSLSRAFINPISQISNQINAVIMAMAGAARIFTLMDEPIEEDEGTVSLVNARIDENGELTQSDKKTNLWAWRKENEDGTVAYKRLAGDVVFENVDFGYVPDKPVLHNLNSTLKLEGRSTQNTGLDLENVQAVKNYLFMDKSYYDPDIKDFRRFDPDCAIAQSWQRLMIGKDIKPHDKTLLNHEIYEMEIKKNNPGIKHEVAHEIAAKKYNYGKEADEYYGNLEKHSKK